MKVANRQKNRAKRQKRVRAKVFGTAEKPRLNVFRSSRSLYVQLIDDSAGKTLASIHGKEIDVKKLDVKDNKGKVASAFLAGKMIAEKAKKLDISKAIFDRGGYKYHGRVAAVADGARDGGLEF
ncbi:MAG: 50S ribosomal protein L18 [Candidatus Magasanikbacteria bacterium]|nr:50S ribosomal protein L18 [Candidatus Magasanikbacteria bacterium]